MHDPGDNMNCLYGMTSAGERFAVSSYVTYWLAKPEATSPEVIATLAMRLDTPHNPSSDGFFLQW